MDTRQSILTHARRLAVERRQIPSLNDVAQAAGLSKGGLIHHFPSRLALLEGLAEEAIADVDAELTDARHRGDLVRTWLSLSLPGSDGVALFQSLAVTYLAPHGESTRLTEMVAEANSRWESLLATELGGHELALTVRLIGDGFLLNALTGSDGAAAASRNLDVILSLVERMRRSSPR